MKNALMGGALAAAALAVLPSAAQARTYSSFSLYVGNGGGTYDPYYDRSYDDGYYGAPAYGYYSYPSYDYYPRYRDHDRWEHRRWRDDRRWDRERSRHRHWRDHDDDDD